jgi:hypothetical protein
LIDYFKVDTIQVVDHSNKYRIFLKIIIALAPIVENPFFAFMANKKIAAESRINSKKVQMKEDFLEKTAATTAVLGLGLSLSSFESSS